MSRVRAIASSSRYTSSGIWDHPMYADFFAAGRDVKSRLPADARVRVFGGDPGPGDNRSRETAAVSVLKEQVLQRHAKALVIYGAAHFYRTAPENYLSSMGQDIGIVRVLEQDYPGRTLAVNPVGGGVFNCRGPGGCVSMFKEPDPEGHLHVGSAVEPHLPRAAGGIQRVRPHL
ncbi:MAG: hypothetical protein JO099_07315 [Acidobacteriia bacterium]|nr:hypothetical protein [Terriglobia bacterium]